MQKFEKTIVLDYSTWRAGGKSGKNKVGTGKTSLCNKQGFMCCLGQASLQLNTALTRTNIINQLTPGDVHIEIPFLHNNKYEWPYHNSELSNKAMLINDNAKIDTIKRIKQLRALFKEHNLGLKVINRPK